MNRLSLIAAGLVLAAFSCLSLAADKADAITGVWLTQDKDGYIEIFEEGGKYHGKIIGAPNDKPRKDSQNPDPELRERSLLGVRIMQDFEYQDESVWSGGTVYDPDSGKTYSGKVTLTEPNILELRGFVGVSLFGRTTTWTRLTHDAAGFDPRAGITEPR